jgi:hypothetical protein
MEMMNVALATVDLLCTHPRVEETLDIHGPPLSLWPLPRRVVSGDDEQNQTA